MSAKTYFRWCFGVPLLLPIVALLLSFLSQWLVETNEATEITRWAAFLLASLYIGGIPYLIFIAGTLYWSRRKTASEIRQFTLFAPLVFAVLLVAAWVPYVLVTERGNEFAVDSALMSAGYYALISVGLGYVYVVVVHAIYYILRTTDRIDSIANEAAA